MKPARRSNVIMKEKTLRLDSMQHCYCWMLISNVDTEEVTIELSEPNRAGIILPNVQEDGENILMLIMPIMLNSYVGM